MQSSTSRAWTKKACLRSRSRRSGTPVKTYRNKISKRSIKRLARRGGVRRISDLVYKEIDELLYVFLKRLIGGSIAYCEYSKRRIIRADDVIRSVRSCGQRLYGFGEPPLPESVRRTTRARTGNNSEIKESIERTILEYSEESFERDEITLNVACAGLNDDNSMRTSVNTADAKRIIANSETNVENGERIIQNSGWNEDNNPIIQNSEIIDGNAETKNSKRNEEIICTSDTRTTGNLEMTQNSKRNEEYEEIICISDTRATGNPEIMRNSKSNAGRLFRNFNQTDRIIKRTEVTKIENSKRSRSFHNQGIITALSSLNDINQIPLITLDDSD